MEIVHSPKPIIKMARKLSYNFIIIKLTLNLTQLVQTIISCRGLQSKWGINGDCEWSLIVKSGTFGWTSLSTSSRNLQVSQPIEHREYFWFSGSMLYSIIVVVVVIIIGCCLICCCCCCCLLLLCSSSRVDYAPDGLIKIHLLPARHSTDTHKST